MTVALKNPNQMMPFNDIISLINNMPVLNTEFREKHNKRSLEITDNPLTLGIFNLLSCQISVLQNRYPPMILKPEIAIFVSNQGVENNINPDMPTIIDNNIKSLKAGKHLINQACNIAGCGLKTYDLNATLPTEDIRIEAAMTEVEATQIMAYSMEAVRDADILVITELGCTEKIVPQSIIKALFCNQIPEDIKFSPAVHEAISLHNVNHAPLEILRRFGSREIAAMIGTIIAARYQNVPIILDGLSAVVAACLVAQINPNAINHCLLGSAYQDPIFDFATAQLGLEPIVSLNIKHDAGIGSTVAINIIKTALAIHNYTDR